MQLTRGGIFYIHAVCCLCVCLCGAECWVFIGKYHSTTCCWYCSPSVCVSMLSKRVISSTRLSRLWSFVMVAGYESVLCIYDTKKTYAHNQTTRTHHKQNMCQVRVSICICMCLPHRNVYLLRVGRGLILCANTKTNKRILNIYISSVLHMHMFVAL